ncbi:MAG: hypothetical protein QNL01_11630, partial [Akkermansiaceae bacterium]
MNKLTLITTLVASAAVCLLHSSCREKGEVQHFRTPKADKASQAETPTPASPAAPTSPAAGATKSAPYSWMLPDGWTALPASGMRLATINIPSTPPLSASITEFGGTLAGNVNRWRGQLGLTALPESEVAATLQEIETKLGKGYIVSLFNPATPKKGLLAAIIPRPSGRSVFIKIPGD